MPEPFSQEFRASWSDMDFNQHMANSAFLGWAEQTRMLFLDSRGWTMARFAEMQIGPVVIEDRLTYRREIRMLEPFTVDHDLAGATSDARRIKIRNQFLTPEGKVCATVDSIVLWFDLAARKPTVPDADLRDAWLGLARTADFEDWG